MSHRCRQGTLRGVDLIHQGKLDKAEQATRELLERFPNVHDGWDRRMVYEARGDHRQAANCYRRVIALIRAHPNDYDAEVGDVFQKLVDRPASRQLIPTLTQCEAVSPTHIINLVRNLRPRPLFARAG